MITSWFTNEFQEGFVSSSGNGVIRYSFKKGGTGQGTIIIVPGRTEFIEKYMELCWDLRELDHSICIYDHLGQGKSDRQLKDRQKGHITDFKIYVSDLEHIIQSVVLPAQTGPVTILGHSMGATISVLVSQSGRQRISGLVLVSPMFQIYAGKFLPPLWVEFISNAACMTGGGSGYVWGGGPYNTESRFDNNPLTTDADRFRRNNELVRQNMDLALGSPTYGWLQQAYRAMRQVRRRADAGHCPTIILRTIDERVVGLKEMEAYCHGATDCRLVTYERCQHELLMERDEIRDDLLDRVRQFLA